MLLPSIFYFSWNVFYPFLKHITRRQILDSSKLKEFADDNFKFDENGRKLSKRLENTVGKGEIALNLSSANAFNLDQSKILSFGMELKLLTLL